MNGFKRDRRFGLDRDTAERMFAGLSADDAPPDYAAVASLLAAAATVDESVAPGEYAAVRAYRDAMRAGTRVGARRRVPPWRTAAGRIAVFATASTLAIGGGVAAAATGSLPAPAQRVAHHVLGGLGVPSVSVLAGPADHVRIGDSVAPSVAPGATVRLSARLSPRTEEPATTEVVPAEAPALAEAAAPATDADTDTDATDHGEAVSSVARSADPGPTHGAEVCFVASAGECLADRKSKDAGDDQSTSTGVAKGHQNDDATEDDRKTSGLAKGHHKDDATADFARDGRKGNGLAKGHHKDDATADFARDGRKGNGLAKGHQDKGSTAPDSARGDQNGAKKGR